MKGVVLAGGLGSRLRPMTLVINKHLLPVYDRPMIEYPIKTLLNLGIDDILIVTGSEHADDFHKLLQDGEPLGAKRLTYAWQEGERGIADALRQAEEFAADEKICVVLGDNLMQGNLRKAANDFADQPRGAKVILKQVPDPQRFGVARIENDRITQIIEKPDQPPSDLAVTGFYFYDHRVFDVVRELQPSARNELEITDVNNAYLQRGELTHDHLPGWWADAGTIEGLYRATRLVAEGGANHLEDELVKSDLRLENGPL